MLHGVHEQTINEATRYRIWIDKSMYRLAKSTKSTLKIENWLKMVNDNSWKRQPIFTINAPLRSDNRFYHSIFTTTAKKTNLCIQSGWMNSERPKLTVILLINFQSLGYRTAINYARAFFLPFQFFFYSASSSNKLFSSSPFLFAEWHSATWNRRGKKLKKKTIIARSARNT